VRVTIGTMVRHRGDHSRAVQLSHHTDAEQSRLGSKLSTVRTMPDLASGVERLR